MRPFGSMLRNTRGHLAQQGITFAQLAFQLVVTVVGVYIAIYLQDAADQRSRARAAQRTLAAVEAELAADEANLDRIIAAQRAQSELMLRIGAAVANPGSADTMLHRILVEDPLANPTFFSRGAAYSALVSTGQLEHIDDQALRLALAQIYEHDYERLQLNGELSDQVWQDVFRRAQLGFWDYERRRPIAGTGVERIHFANATHRVRSFARNYIMVMEETRDRVRATRRMVADYLDD